MSEIIDNVPALEIHDLIVSYQKKPVLYGVDLSIPEGSMVGIVGPNGAGKSTLIKTVMGLVPHAHGWVKIFGGDLKKSIFSKVFELSVHEQGCFGTVLGMFSRLYNGLHVTRGLAEKIAKNTSKNGFFFGKKAMPPPMNQKSHFLRCFSRFSQRVRG